MAQPLSARDCHHHSLGEPSQIWVYRDERGDVLQHIARYDTADGEKEFRPWTYHDGEWIQKGPTGPRPLFGLDKLANMPESSVIVCEGEKAADAAQRLYPYAVTISWSGGSSSVAKSDWTPLRGREVTIWPDADAAGAKASRSIVDSLRGVAMSVHVANVSDKPDKWDAADAEELGWTPLEVDELLASAEFFSGERPLRARTYDANFNSADIPVRPWIIHGMLMRRYLTAVFAPAGVGKSVFSLAIAIMAATERKLLGREQHEQASVLYINNEDDQDEIDRRVAGICRQHGIPHEELNGRLYTASGYGDPLTIAKLDADGTVVQHPDVERIMNFCRKHDIGVIVLDPFVSTHDIPENNNSEIEKVATTYRTIAKATNAAILLVHHTRKIGSDTEAHAGDAEAGRGASSLIGAVRIAFTLARMSKAAADKRGIDWELGNQLIRMDDGKMNFARMKDEADWYKMVSVDIGNGEKVGVPVPFDMAEISRLADQVKAEERASQNQIRISEIVADVAKCMTEDKQPQPEVIGAYKELTGKGKTAVNDAFMMLPVGMGDAFAGAKNDGENIFAIAAIQLLILTGCRKAEVLTLRWDYVDIERAFFVLPDSKTGHKVVPLGAPVMELLASLPRIAGNPYVLPGKKEGHHFVGLRRVWLRIRDRAGLNNVRLHDLRHSFASVGASAGMGLQMVGKLLGHKDPKTTQRYAHIADDPAHAAANSISGSIAKALDGNKGELIELSKRN